MAKETKSGSELARLFYDRLRAPGTSLYIYSDETSGWVWSLYIRGDNPNAIQQRANEIGEELRRLYDLKD